MRAIVLGASQGARLIPMTENQPASLLPVGSRSILHWQLAALSQSRIVEEIVVVAGFKAALIETAVEALPNLGVPVSVIFDPFHRVAGSLASCWMARRHLTGEVLIVDGNLLFEVAAIPRLMNAASAPATVAVGRRSATPDGAGADYRESDMRHASDADGDARFFEGAPLGLIHLTAEGTAAFVDVVESCAAANSLGQPHMAAVRRLAERGIVGVARLDDVQWEAVVTPDDLERAAALAISWERLRIVA
jgi:choline kinase